MKTISIFAIAFCWAILTSAQMHNVTFQVDMSNETVTANGVFVAGNFQSEAGFPNDWNPSTTPMTDPDGDSIYSVMVSLPDTTYDYKFVNGNAWGMDEGIPQTCAVNGNRTFTVVGSDLILPVDCFGRCGACPPPPDTIYATLKVDMRNYIRQYGMVFPMVSVAGDFQAKAGLASGQNWADWTPGQTILTDADADSVYEITFRVPEGDYGHQFIAGDEWAEAEPIMLPTVSLFLQGNPGDTVVITRCFGEAGACTPLGTIQNVTFRVDMSNELVDPDSVFMKGTGLFPSAYTEQQLVKQGNTDIFAATLPLYTNRIYGYKFVIRSPGSVNDENGDTFVTDGCGLGDFGKHRKLDLTVLSTDTILPPSIFSSCFSTPDAPIYYSVYAGVNNVSLPQAWLIQYDTATQQLHAVDSSMGSTPNQFLASYVNGEGYLLKAALDSLYSTPTDYASYLPTYHPNALFWDSATVIYPNPNSTPIKIVSLIPGNNPGGPGFISGNVLQGANKAPGDGLAGLDVLLLNQQNQPITWTKTDAAGAYKFSNIPLMGLRVFPQFPGKKTTPKDVTLSASAPTASVDFEVSLSITPVEAGLAPAYGRSCVQPNPARESATLVLDAARPMQLRYSLCSVQGQSLRSSEMDVHTGANSLTMSLEALPAGLYFVHLYEGNQRVATHKLVKE